jgi:hypothetical protein
MAFSLQNNKKVIVENFYKDYIENLVKDKTSKSYSTLKAEDIRMQSLKSAASLYIKLEGVNSDINSAEDLFDLAKMLGIPPSDGYTITSDEGETISTYDPQRRAMVTVPKMTPLGDVPVGASSSSKNQIFQQKFFPLIEQHYARVLSSPNLDDITKSVLKQWWGEQGSSLESVFLANIADPIIDEDVGSLNDLNGAEIDIAGIENNAVKLRKVFFTSLFAKDGNFKANILDALGFSQYLRDNKGIMGQVTDPLLTLEGLEQAAKANPGAFKNIVTSALGISRDINEEDLNDLNQCALVTALIHDEPTFNFRKYIEDDKYKPSPLRASGSGNQRIYPVQINSYNPNKLVNNCVINRKIKNIFSDEDTKGPHNLIKGLYWVYEDNKNELREAELSTNLTVHRKKVSKTLNVMGESSNFSLDDVARFDKFDRTRDSSYYFLENTKITFDGTNPSTARNDVKVEMTWKLGSLEGLSSHLAILSTSDGLDADTVITIKDLITLPITKKPNASDGPGQFLTNQYSPNYSRLRLKVAPYGDKKGSFQSDCMILDLAIIDHQINRSSETGETTLTISYRGYFEATLNMPFNDALASPQTIINRETRQKEALDGLMKNDCKPELIREALRLEQQVFARESADPSSGAILLRMQARNLIHSYELDQTRLLGGTFGNVLDGRQMYVSRVIPRQSPMLATAENQTLAEVVFDKKVDTDDNSVEDGDVDRVRVLKKIDKKFFFLGDLMWVLLDCLYKSYSADHRANLKNLNLRFIMGTIYVPNPKNLGGAPITVNPISIPVDLKFFVQWFNATIVNKGLTHYPIGTFIRDLVERLINDIVYDTCFSLLLPDENPPLLRARTFTSSEDKWFKKTINGAWFDPNSPHGNGRMDVLFPKSMVSLSSREDTWSQKIISKNYCVIYQQFPSYKRQLAAEKNSTLKQDEYTPTIYYGAKNKNYNFLSNVSFIKTNSPYLREARYFNTNYGGLSLLANVYDLSFSFKRRKANTLFYPGCIINFVLVDWGKRWVEEPPWTGKGGGTIHHLGVSPNPPITGFQEGRLGESDPHNEGTISNIMGMGGYFIIKSVEYNLGQTPGEFEINITTKFLGTDSAKVLNRTDNKEKFADASEKCADIFNTIAERYNELSRNDPNYVPIVTVGVQAESTDDTLNTGEKVSEVVAIETSKFKTSQYGTVTATPTKLLPSITDIASGLAASTTTEGETAAVDNPFAIFEEPVDE